MEKWMMHSVGLLLIWPLIVFKEGIDAGDTFSKFCGLFGSVGLGIGVVLPLLLFFAAGVTSPIVFVAIALIYLVLGVLVHLNMWAGWRANILQFPYYDE